MRFSDIRRSVVKQTLMDNDNRKHTEVATVQRISPFEDRSAAKLRHGVKSGDVLWPTTNRARRRANGQTKPRKRIRDTLPPHPLQVINAAHRIEREGIRTRAKKARQDAKAGVL